MFHYGSPSDENPRREALELWANYITQRVETEARFDDRRLNEQFNQISFAHGILRVSPTVIYRYAMEALAGAGFPRHRRFISDAQQYRRQFISFIKEADGADPASPHIYYVKEGLSKKPVSFDAVPRFIERSGVGVAMAAALVDLCLLILISVAFFMVSFVTFLKCRIR